MFVFEHLHNCYSLFAFLWAAALKHAQTTVLHAYTCSTFIRLSIFANVLKLHSCLMVSTARSHVHYCLYGDK